MNRCRRLRGPDVVIACVLLMLAGCGTVVPVVPKLVPCQVAATQLQESCAQPRAITGEPTFSDVIGIALQDRASLRLCAERHAALQAAILACNAAIAEHNRKLDDLNSQSSKRP